MVLIASVQYSDQEALNAGTQHARKIAAPFVHTCLSAQVSRREKSRARWTQAQRIADALYIKFVFVVRLQRYREMPFAPQTFSELQSISLLVHVLLYNVSKTTTCVCVCVCACLCVRKVL